MKTTFDIAVYQGAAEPFAPAAESAAMTATNELNAYRLARHGTYPAARRALAVALRFADEISRSTTEALGRTHHQLTPDT
ncbi:hypothetical protein ACFV42_47660 [Streptomyces solisilvae]|uniref:hypothetical protein n=1 Tax=Streptomyces malaysiensis TaxID=92644 RepID=UPI003689B6B7